MKTLNKDRLLDSYAWISINPTTGNFVCHSFRGKFWSYNPTDRVMRWGNKRFVNFTREDVLDWVQSFEI